ncbi:MAG: DNA polymerase III subunit delta [Kangiellaceae bacterium]
MKPSVHIVSSDEVLLQQECCDQIINAAKQEGITERKIVDVVDKFSWNDLIADSNSLSLFAEAKLTDIRFTKSPKKDAQQALVELVADAAEDNQFLIRLPKIEKRQKSTKWFKSLASNASVQELWPPKTHSFFDWIANRALQKKVQLETEATAMLAEQTEGNLLAASQTLDKLALLYGETKVDISMLRTVISDNARYSVFLCLDEALSGQGQRAVRMLKKFEMEGVAPISILVNLTREIGLCNQVSTAVSQGQSGMQALSSSYLWESKKKLIISASNRLPLAVWQKLVVRCGFLDRMVKGQEQGRIWQELESCLWLLSGRKIWGVKR